MPPADAPKKKEPVGPMVAVIIILLLMLGGAIYFFQEQQRVRTERQNIPYIPGDATSTPTADGSSTVIIESSTTVAQ